MLIKWSSCRQITIIPNREVNFFRDVPLSHAKSWNVFCWIMTEVKDGATHTLTCILIDHEAAKDWIFRQITSWRHIYFEKMMFKKLFKSLNVFVRNCEMLTSRFHQKSILETAVLCKYVHVKRSGNSTCHILNFSSALYAEIFWTHVGAYICWGMLLKLGMVYVDDSLSTFHFY